jgi:hypothetical protein
MGNLTVDRVMDNSTVQEKFSHFFISPKFWAEYPQKATILQTHNFPIFLLLLI